MIKGGKGGGRTITGLKFEKRVSLEDVFKKVFGYAVRNNLVYFNMKKVAQICGKHKLYREFLEPQKIYYKKIISRKLLPDEAIFVIKTNTLYIVEMKFQEVEGSVDEKLQTCGFKIQQYKKLLNPLGIKVEYIYVLNDWFKQEKYKDVLEYAKLCGCKHFFNEIPLNKIGLPRLRRGNSK